MSNSKKQYLVVECPRCDRFLLAMHGNKTRMCPYCEKRVIVEKARIVTHSENAEEARSALQKLKIPDSETSLSKSER